MTPHPLLAAGLLILCLLVALALGMAGRALILAFTHRGRYDARHEAPPPPLPPEKSASELGFSAELDALPAKGKDYISDQTVRLPWTPPLTVWQPSRTLTDAEAAEIKERFLAAQGQPPTILSEPSAVEPADVDAQVAEWQQILAPAEPEPEAASPPDVADVLPAWVIDALNGHQSVDAAVESIVARTVSDA